ncbi:MAG: ATP-binding protein [Chloroflexi bacterium]|nr:ATP-binding protein [Chloroflexota bacterium]
MRSLTLKLILAFLLISVIGIGLAAVLARMVTGREFDRFIMDRSRVEFVANAAAYYQTRGSWVNADDYFRQLGVPPEPGAPQRPLQFVLVDQAGTVVTPSQPYRAGERISAKELARGKPIVVDGRQVGTVLDAGRAPALNDREAQYLASTNQALALAAFGAVAIALLLGVLLARNLTRPLRDLTQAIQAMSRGELKQQVPVRSSDELGALTQAFNQMSADLARSNELRRQMTADIAHDLRTPLTVITGYIEALRDGVLKPTPARFEAMNNEAQQLKRLVEDLRTLSLADAGELPLARQSISPRMLLERLAAVFTHRAEQGRIALAVAVDEALPEVNVDVERMVQVLENLVSNALRHTPAGGQITLSAHAEAGAMLMTVQDTGEGIPPDVLPHIFDRFYRGDVSRGEQGGESGLGLAIAKSIVEAHGGVITAASVLGQGTTFTVTLPSS